jgi:hypothetical protein
MKYIITEEQNERLEKTIMKFFDKNLTPLEGWESHEDYASELNTSSELFFVIGDDEGWGNMTSDNHVWYSECDNENLSEPLSDCPVVALPKSTYDALKGYFGDKWKKLFRRWFIMNTGLLVVKIDSL